MHLNYTEEQLAIQASLERYLGASYTFEDRRAIQAAGGEGFSRKAWAVYAEMGLLALPFPESLGGLGGRPIDVALVAQTLGGAMALEPYVPAVVVCGRLLMSCGSDAMREKYIPALAGGETILALAHYENGARYANSHVASTARRVEGGWRLDGAKAMVHGGMGADTFLVSARTQGTTRDEYGITLFAVDRNQAGLSVTARPMLDGCMAADLELDDVVLDEGAIVGKLHDGFQGIDEAIDHGIAASCADAVGVILKAHTSTVEYLKTRKQFGVALGSFQAVQHRLAELYVAAEQARSMAELAALKIEDAASDERRKVASASKVLVGKAARLVGHTVVQLHGGMGVVDEMSISHQFKRLLAFGAAYGDVDFHIGRYGALMNENRRAA